MTTPLPTASAPSPEALAAAYEECRRVTRREARNFYFAFLTLPARQRRAIYVAYTFCRYCDDSVDAEGTHAEKLQRVERLRGTCWPKPTPELPTNRCSSAWPTSPQPTTSRRNTSRKS